MADLKFACWNMEWLNELFEPDRNGQPPSLKDRGGRPPMTKSGTVGQRLDDLAGVVGELSPDVLVLTEGPNRKEELQLLFDTVMPGTWATYLQETPGSQQNTGIAVRTDSGNFADPPLGVLDPPVAAAFGPFERDTDDDEILERYRFERTPLYVEITPSAGRAFRILGLHLKSKGIFRAYEWSKWWQLADANRRKILAQTFHLRETFIDPYLTSNQTSGIPLIVCGDINDGPGLDASEKRLLGSGIERLMGCIWHPKRCLRNAIFESLDEDDQMAVRIDGLSSTRFKDPIFDDYLYVWIDHILYTDNIGEQWVTNGEIRKKMSGDEMIWTKYPHASDHQPVTATLHL